MNILLWVLQVIAALMYGASGVMKVFMFEQISKDVRPFGALPRNAWTGLGLLELLCVVGLIVPAALRWHPVLTAAAAALLAAESLVFIWVHAKYRETGTIIVCVVLGLLMGFIAYGRLVLKPSERQARARITPEPHQGTRRTPSPVPPPDGQGGQLYSMSAWWYHRPPWLKKRIASSMSRPPPASCRMGC